jgi:hypothetical protein
VTLEPPESNQVTLWVLRIFDGDPSEPATKRPHAYYREVHPAESPEECLAEAERALRSFYGLGGWVKDAVPLAGFSRSWNRKAS